MTRSALAILAVLCAALPVLPAQAGTVTICTAAADAVTGEMLRQEGACDTSVTSASTFKIAIALMGYDSGILTDEHTPEWPFRAGYPDWRPSWRAATDPARWMRESVVWYSQQITERLGEERFARYVAAFGYGNEDVSGDPGKANGLTRAWLSSSLKISPLGQLAFLGKVVRRELPVSARAHDMTQRLVDIGETPGGWHVYGKTGAGLPRRKDGTLKRGHAYGWFVGWAVRDGRTVVFARLIQDSERQSVPPGFRARDSVLAELFSGPGAL